MGQKTLWLLGALTILLLAPTTTAQGDGCTASTPCPWEVTVDETGFSGDMSFNATQGDWFSLDLFNLDLSQPHTVTLEGYGLSWTAGSLEDAQSQPFALGKAGTFHLVDDVTGDTLLVQVFTGDVVDAEQNGTAATATSTSTQSSGHSVPAPALPLVAAALVAVAAIRRR